MENKSIWQYGIKSLKYNKLDKDIRCDVLIIGGGIAGLSCAYFLKNSKYKTVLVDKNMCGMGISARSTGKLTFMQDLIYNKIKDNYDEDKALMYLNSQKDAVKIVRDIIIKNFLFSFLKYYYLFSFYLIHLNVFYLHHKLLQN